MAGDRDSLEEFLRAVAGELPPELALDLGVLGGEAIRGWTVCEFSREKVFGGRWDAWTTTNLLVTTSGALVLRTIGWYGDDQSRLDHLHAPTQGELLQLDQAYRSEDRPSYEGNGGDGGTIQAWGYTGDRMFPEDFGGVRHLVDEARHRLAAVDIAEFQAAQAAEAREADDRLVAGRAAADAQEALRLAELDRRQAEERAGIQSTHGQKMLTLLRDREAIRVFMDTRNRLWNGGHGTTLDEAIYQGAIDYDAVLATDLTSWEAESPPLDFAACETVRREAIEAGRTPTEAHDLWRREHARLSVLQSEQLAELIPKKEELAIGRFVKTRDTNMMRYGRNIGKFSRGTALHLAVSEYKRR